MKLGAVAYTYPLTPSTWGAYNATPAANEFIIANPSNGDFTVVDPNYSAAINASKTAGNKVIGYVYTNYAARSAAAIKTNIDAWYAFYPNIDGIFFDEMNASCTTTPYYSDLVQYAQSKGATITVLNPGNAAPSCFDGIASHIVTFEGSENAYFSLVPQAWEATATSKIFHIVYESIACQSNSVGQIVSLATTKNADVLFVTGDAFNPNPFDSISTCWSDLAAAVSGSNIVDVDINNTVSAYSPSVTPGGTAIYDWVIGNNGPGAMVNMPISSVLAANVTSRSWMVAGGNGGSYSAGSSGTGPMSGTVSIPSGGFIHFVLNDVISAATVAPTVSATGAVTIPNGYNDINGGNNIPYTALVNVVSTPPATSPRVLKSVSQASVNAGGQLTWTVTLENPSASSVVASVVDVIPAEVATWVWSTVITGVATGVTSTGVGNWSDVITLQAGAKVVATFVANIKTVGVGSSVTNTVNVTWIISGNASTESKSVVTNIVPAPAQVGSPYVTKIPSVQNAAPGDTVSWTINVINQNSFTLHNIKVQDAVPLGMASWGYTAAGSAGTSGFFTSGNTGINDTLTIPPGGSVVYTPSGKISTVGFPPVLSNVVNYTNSEGRAHTPITSSIDIGGTACFRVTVLPQSTTVTAGGIVVYQVYVENVTGRAISNVRLVDGLHSFVQSRAWQVFSGNTFGVSGVPSTGTGGIDVYANFDINGYVTLSVVDTLKTGVYGLTCNNISVGLPPGFSSTCPLSVKSNDVVVLAKPVDKIIDSEKLWSRYTNRSLCASVDVSVTVTRPVEVCGGALNDWTIRMPVKVTVNNVPQVLKTSEPKFRYVSGDGPGCESGVLMFTETFTVPPGKLLEVYGSTIFSPNKGVYVSEVNEVTFGTGTIVVSE